MALQHRRSDLSTMVDSSETFQKPSEILEETEEYHLTREFQGVDIIRSDTPETLLPELSITPDISIVCEKCKEHIDLPSLKDHRIYHNNLSILKYNGSAKPPTTDALLRRRNAILRKLKSAATADKPLDPKSIQRVNDAYEYLKSEIDGSFGEFRHIDEEVSTAVKGVALNCTPACVTAIGICSTRNERWKSYMEDAHVYQDFFGEDRNKCYLALFDGHHGRFAAEIAAAELHHLLLYEMAKFDPRTKSMPRNIGENQDMFQYQFERPSTKESERVILHEESVNIVQQIINLCEDKYDEIIKDKSLSLDMKEKAHSEETPKSDDEKNTKTDITEKTPRKKKKEKSAFTSKMEDALKKTYYLIDILLSYGKDECSRVRWSGSSALTLVIHNTDNSSVIDRAISPVPEEEEEVKSGETDDDAGKEDKKESGGLDPPRELGMIYLANAGNVRAVLVRGNKPYTLTKDHSPNNLKEKERIVKAGGDISESTKEMRVNGVLAATRGFGNHGDVKLKRCVLVDPHTITVPVDQYAQFLILASHGVWEVFTEQEAASLLLKLLPSNFIPAPSTVSSSIEPLLEPTTSKCQNITGPSQRRVSFSQAERNSTPSERSKQEQEEEELKVEVEVNVEPQTPFEDEPQLIAPKREKLKSAGSVISEKSENSDQTHKSKKSGKSPRSMSAKSVRSVKSDKDGKSKLIYYEDDMLPEIGSHVMHSDDEDSGNDADIETVTDILSIPAFSRLSNYGRTLSREHIQREFAKTMAEHLIQAALLAGAKDNITVTVVLLAGCGL
ncbi:LOW QUALITY PROTEIN: protein phosphatase 2C-like domain-containing protein 1 [Pecten maximus]|uniref:LOW QUALITY PROTEIN: protein phosphatase 2C-like domain-containing protein 1 n=1 Tax=Pecten maximus TaxID=6579 RepID=UPI0014588357|nr:LOW QUALITY PROTEIN: protein phosphatase 2C-like domain-containing protein 1 [Pecten maximus]